MISKMRHGKTLILKSRGFQKKGLIIDIKSKKNGKIKNVT
jgi:hypothetical protein